MMKLTTLFLLLLGVNFAVEANDVSHTIYLVRHAEKQLGSGKNPALTKCGAARAEALAEIFRAVKLSAIYSSEYRRTMNTAKPTALQQGLEIETYDPGKLKTLASTLQMAKQNALVVGHSNTTATLAGLLSGDESMGPYSEALYDRLYQVVLWDGGSRNHLLHQSFHCSPGNSQKS